MRVSVRVLARNPAVSRKMTTRRLSVSISEVFAKNGGCPAAELRVTRRTHAITYGEDGIEIVEGNRPPDIAHALNLNYRGFLGSCIASQFAVLVNVLQVQPNVVLTDLKQLGNLPLAQPNSGVDDAKLDCISSVFGYINYDVCGRFHE